MLRTCLIGLFDRPGDDCLWATGSVADGKQKQGGIR